MLFLHLHLLTILFLAISSYVKNEKIFSKATSGRCTIVSVVAIPKATYTLFTSQTQTEKSSLLPALGSRFSGNTSNTTSRQNVI